MNHFQRRVTKEERNSHPRASAQNLFITKANGEQEPFNPLKLVSSLRRAGASSSVIKRIVNHIEAELKPGMTTHEIYEHAFSLLAPVEKIPAARYSMKRAVLALGPSGFPFENFVAEIFKAQGFSVVVGGVVPGKCVNHEIDVSAIKGRERIGAELKFHNALGLKSDLKAALYVAARFEDIVDGGSGPTFTASWFITNTKFTANAVQYGKCVGLTMISWNYPPEGNLQDLIEASHVQPITALTSLSGSEKLRLLERRVVLCRSVQHEEEVLRSLGFGKTRVDEIVEESRTLCGIE